MPIHPDLKPLYPENRDEISRRVRFERAGNRCEWRRARNHEPHPETGARAVLTAANNAEGNRAAFASAATTNTMRPSAAPTANTAPTKPPVSSTLTAT